MDCKDNQHKSCSLDMGRGCSFCNCESEPSARVCEGCFKLHTTDWLDGMPQVFESDIFEIRFKNTRRSYYKNVNGLDLKRGDIVAVEASPGHDIGIVSLTGDMVARQMKRVGFNPLNGEFKKIYRKAKPYDIEKWQEAIAMEHETMIRSRQIAAEMGLNMKIGDVEYQGDKIKAIFYYIADERVDFRELIKVFAEQFRIRVEMKQIGARQEAGRIGGLGSCGRELCCASWISSFVSVTTNAARAQEISLNPQKLAGQCSKLKCCMIYELDSYLDSRKDFPRIHHPLQTIDGEYYLVKSDILGKTMSFSTSPGGMAGIVTLPISRVYEILEMNKKGRKPDKIMGDDHKEPVKEDPGFVNMVGEESITRFDNLKGHEKRSRNKRSRGKERTGNDEGAAKTPAGDRQNQGRQKNRGQNPNQEGRGPRRDANQSGRKPGEQGRPSGDKAPRNESGNSSPERKEGGQRNRPPRKPGGQRPGRGPREKKSGGDNNGGENSSSGSN